MQLPVLIQDFNMYDTRKGSETLVGISGEVTLPTVAFKTLDISGPGISGEMAVAVYGATEKMEVDIPFRSLTPKMFEMLAPGSVKLTLRGSVQNTDLSTQDVNFKGIRIDMRGQCFELNPGKVKKEEDMGSSIKLTLSYFAIYLDGKNVLEIDKFGPVLKVNGVDLMKKIRDLC